ncbi:hypothetical protein L249_0005 [Ophiocordyceps polyrhachis-furcata BCC 54312]|uniref:AAA+ ATPase domain-containing protein n=1 Tax=Ophiocordyceps polyrhachis-furcata BCC 54312 TaxID=1330021 RepID=A0A367LCV6_9HYPO|nr:hypothetical protein L249_0005 [Ophiocordyceps polyrhachis-furcata BCC 54312]
MFAATAFLSPCHAAPYIPRLPSVVACRAFHFSVCRRRNEGAGGKPIEDSVTEQDGDAGSHIGTEMLGGRVRGQTTGSYKYRQSRKHVTSALPPVQLPKSFLEQRVTLYSPRRPPTLPRALAEDLHHEKVSRLYSAGTEASTSQKTYQSLEKYFSMALTSLQKQHDEMLHDILTADQQCHQSPGAFDQLLERLLRLNDMIIDASWHLVDSLYPCRQAEYVYKVRPFWWWDIYDDPDCPARKFRDQHPDTSTPTLLHFKTDPTLEYPPSHALADLPIDALVHLMRTFINDLGMPPPPNLDSKTIKRPITVLSLSGYGGQAIAEAVGKHIAYDVSADLIQVDAYDLSTLVGDYLGQNWAYSRGAVSMMGFRAAELNGKLVADPEPPGKQESAEDADSEPIVNGIRASYSSTLDEELQKIKHGTSACFTRWENLKIEKILDHIIRSADLKRSSPNPRPVIIHVHDIVELSMTLEGSLIINKIRALVDSAWQQGTHIAFLGTSSCEQPSDEYQSAIRELAVGDLVITRRIQPDRADKHVSKTSGVPTFNLQKADYIAENLANTKRMLGAIHPDLSLQYLEQSLDALKEFYLATKSFDATSRGPILPIPQIYQIATAIKTFDSRGNFARFPAFARHLANSPLREKQVHNSLDEQLPKEKAENAEKSTVEARQIKVNEYEKRISTGQIDPWTIQTTFADIHAPAETISTLKLLTTLALVRPDAFSYGVLAQDRIPGCLLYGPPGTGKTMLAKAVAKESGAKMLEISGASINDKWVGESEKLIRAIFTLAKRISPCVVFIDEADSLLASRGASVHRAARREHINQFLKEWDGMEKTTAFIMVATNRPLDLDEAVLRRLPRRILVDLPTRDDRTAILRLLLRGEMLDESISIDEYADRTTFYSGSDLKNMCVAAAMAAVEEENEAATKHKGPEPFRYPERRILRKAHFEKAIEQIPASISEDMDSLKMIRKFDREYGNANKGAKKKKVIGFGDLGHGRLDDIGVRRSSQTGEGEQFPQLAPAGVARPTRD